MGGFETRGSGALEFLGVILILGSLGAILMGAMFLWGTMQSPFTAGMGGFAAIILIFGIAMLIAGIFLLKRGSEE